MIEFAHLTSTEIAAVDKRLPVIIPVGLVEAHGPHLPLSVDMDTAAYFSRTIAERAGAILAPQLVYGFADEMREYPGTIGLTAGTLTTVITELSLAFCRSGFTRQIFLSGHGANKTPVELAFFNVWETFPELRAVCWNYWTEAGMTHIHHADKGETEIAMAVGTPCYPERARDFKVNKPWYKIRSRYALDPESGGINGKPTEAVLAEGEAARDEIVRILSEKVGAIIEAETR
ncbi:MAG: creatininase family protein [Opitutales bacterium]